ncbi:phosphatidate cytidylyltransferase [bacterium]|nr:phosphatidate cytidylyltransferase [bacterium]
MSNFLQRAIITVFAVPVLIFVFLSGGFYFAGFSTIVSCLIVWETCKMLEAKGFSPNFPIAALATFGFGHCFFWGQNSLLVLFLATFSTLLFELFRNRENPFLNVSGTVFAFVYGGMFFNTAILIREKGFANYDFGGKFILLVFTSIWICDTFAYLGGKNYGKNKLFERISPKKTWEGSLTGFLGSVLWCFGAKIFILTELTFLDCAVLGVLTGLVSQFGDLAESMLKRDAKVKDSSNLIPGHGGVFDRFDSLIFILPLVWIYLETKNIFKV